MARPHLALARRCDSAAAYIFAAARTTQCNGMTRVRLQRLRPCARVLGGPSLTYPAQLRRLPLPTSWSGPLRTVHASKSTCPESEGLASAQQLRARGTAIGAVKHTREESRCVWIRTWRVRSKGEGVTVSDHRAAARHREAGSRIRTAPKPDRKLTVFGTARHREPAVLGCRYAKPNPR